MEKVACAAYARRSALGTEIPKGTVCGIVGSLEGEQFPEHEATISRTPVAALAHNDLGAFARFIVDAYRRQDTGQVIAAFKLIEELLVDGNEEVRTAAAIGFLEDERNIASWRLFGSVVFVQWLGPKSKEAWAEIEEMWRDKKSLADVVRAERAAAKNKPQS